MMITAIETEYKGYRFRSRLEARWAVFFDALGIKWQYEPEGFEKDVKGRIIRYLPDFYLPETGTWVEVKWRWNDRDAVDTFHMIDVDTGSPLWHMGVNLNHFSVSRTYEEDHGIKRCQACFGLLLLGDIPDVDHGACWHPMLVPHEFTMEVAYVEFGSYSRPYLSSKLPNKVQYEAVHLLAQIRGIEIETSYNLLKAELTPELHIATNEELGSKLLPIFNTKPIIIKTGFANPHLMNAYKSAKSARFEFGEHGAPKNLIAA